MRNFSTCNSRFPFAVNVTLHLSNIFKLQRLVTLKLLVLYCLICLTWWMLQLSLFMQKDTHDHEENVPLMREESSDGKVTTAGYYKVRCCLPSSHGSTMCLNLRVIFRPWVLNRSGNSLFQVVGQCGRAKKASEQWNSERAKNGAKREGESLVSIFSNTSILPVPRPLLEKRFLVSNYQMSKPEKVWSRRASLARRVY